MQLVCPCHPVYGLFFFSFSSFLVFCLYGVADLAEPLPLLPVLSPFFLHLPCLYIFPIVSCHLKWSLPLAVFPSILISMAGFISHFLSLASHDNTTPAFSTSSRCQQVLHIGFFQDVHISWSILIWFNLCIYV